MGVCLQHRVSRRAWGRLLMVLFGTAVPGVPGIPLPESSGGLEAQQLRVVTTTTDLADLARQVGGDRIEVQSLALGRQDPHFVEPRPSLILELRRADLYAQIGLELEVGWAPLLLDQARNASLQPGGAGHLDLSEHVEVLDVPQTRVSRAQGDIHPFGNPHYWLDPTNGLRMAEAFYHRFAQLDPEGEPVYRANLEAFSHRLTVAISEWRALLAPLAERPLVAYHASWRYFTAFAGVEVVGFIEPFPGIPPSPRHLATLVDEMNRAGVRVIISDPFYDRTVPETVARRTGARLLILPSSVSGVTGVESYLELMDHNVRNLVDAFQD